MQTTPLIRSIERLCFICPVIPTYIYRTVSCVLLDCLLSVEENYCVKEGTTHGDQTSMSAYALGILPLLQFLLNFISVSELNVKEVALRLLANFQALITTGAN